MKRIGLMGCGTVANYGHIPAIKATPGIELASIYDPDRERLEAAQKRFDIPGAFTNQDDFFSSGLDGVCITSPAHCHRDNVLAAVGRVGHVLCEKPLALTENDAEEMIEAARRAGCGLYTGLTYRFSPVSQRIRQLVAEKAIGETRILRLIYIWNLHGLYETDESGNRRLRERRVGRMLEGGPMIDCGVHQIDLARWWTGSEVAEQRAFGAWADRFDAPDHVFLHMEHKCGAHSFVEMSYSFCMTAKEPVHSFVYHLIGPDGVIIFDRERRVFEMRTSAGTTRFPVHDEKGFAIMYEAFARAMRTGDPGDLPSGEDGLIATRIARCATEEAMRNRCSPPASLPRGGE
ncbi:MAG TPA: Gfo/Idh/MocA family oxidoreductase [Candidatus Brocadiia bacterium]|nr:Gfo/Idh/MocA family oxidoreductase [Candidatus Brocadiia bacterium]